MKTNIRIKLAAVAAGMLIGLSSCILAGNSSNAFSAWTSQVQIVPSKTYVTKKISLSDVTAVEACASVDIVYYQTDDEAPYAEIYAPDNLIDYIRAEEADGCLKVGWKKDTSISIKGKSTHEVRVYAPEITSFNTSSSSDIHLATPLTTSQPVTIAASSSGDIKGEKVQCANLTLKTSSSGDIFIQHIRCKDLEAAASSSGDIKITSLHCESLEAKSSSSGDCTIQEIACQGDVKASASSSGDVCLSGVCRNASFHSSSSGDLKAKQLKAQNVSANSSSSGDITCYATGTLDVRISSGGSVRYAGTPTQITGDTKKAHKL